MQDTHQERTLVVNLKLLFDLFSTQPVGTTKYHGGGEYGKRLFASIVMAYGSSVDIHACYDDSNYLDDWLVTLLKDYSIGVVRVSSTADIVSVLNTSTFDRFYSPMPYYLRKSDLDTRTRILGTIHGLRPIEMPTDRTEVILSRGALERIKALAKQCIPTYALRARSIAAYHECLDALDHVFTDSEHSRAAIRRWLGYTGDAEVRYPFPKHVPDAQTVGRELSDVPEGSPFILMVSCDRWLKNPARGVRAIDSLFSNGLLDGYSTVCVGMQDASLICNLASRERFIALPYVSAPALEELYRKCDIFFYPTLNEGFGYPPIEAMRYGTTCVVSCTCSVPEICGGAALYCSPTDIGEMGTRLVEAADHHVDAQRVISRHQEIEQRQAADLKAMTSSVILA